MTAGFVTVGHSSRSLDAFVEILQAASVGIVADVRSFPCSRSNPVFNTETLPGDLARVQIGYCHLPRLGGRRGVQVGVDPALNALWRVQSFHNYADYALGGDFAEGLDALLALGRGRRVAVMCSEAVWWRCHRRLIADHLLARGLAVDHLMAPGRVEAARLTPGAVVDGPRVLYPAGEAG